MSVGQVHLSIEDDVASVTFDRPETRNAMTWAMYDQLSAACVAIAADSSLRAAVFRGTGGSFVAGTDIGQFATFEGAAAGLAYEARIEACISAIETLPIPTLAVIEGAAMGGGLILALACDLRVAALDARVGVPIARTVGNGLSAANVARLVAGFGDARARKMLLLASSIEAREALACGFLTEVAPADALGSRAAEIVKRLRYHAPITMRVSKEAIRRLRASNAPDDADLIATAYGSRDFAEGVEAFIANRLPNWRGR